MNKNKFLTILGFIILSIVSIGYDLSLNKTVQKTKSDVDESYYVILDGAFNKTGKYQFHKDDTIQSIIDDIGVLDNANLKAVNVNKKLVDEESIYLPVKTGLCINLNTAGSSDLQKLDRVGEKTAEKIITYRKSHTFNKIEDLQNVSGIGEKTFLRLRDHICI